MRLNLNKVIGAIHETRYVGFHLVMQFKYLFLRGAIAG